MVLEHYINWAICNYPSLYRGKTHESSRIRVLDHIFLCIGTGMEWSPEGYLYDDCYKNPNKHQLKTLPDNFYRMNLYDVTILPKDIPSIRQELKENGKWFNIKKDSYSSTAIFEGTKKFATYITKKYKAQDYLSKVIPGYFYLSSLNRFEREYHPYPMCQYSPIVEMINRRTNSCHIENFDLTFVKKDWLLGAIDVVKEALKYYHDESRYSNDLYYPSKQKIKETRDRSESDPDKYVKLLNDWNLPSGTSVESFCEFIWENHKAEQIDYCNRFLQMYG